MIVVDASALLEFLLQTLLGTRVETMPRSTPAISAATRPASVRTAGSIPTLRCGR